jgi:hypothetical protein
MATGQLRQRSNADIALLLFSPCFAHVLGLAGAAAVCAQWLLLLSRANPAEAAARCNPTSFGKLLGR